MESIILDELDRKLAHALEIDGRASFSRIGQVLGVSETTVARRYRRLRSSRVLRVVGAVNGVALGYMSWTIRLRCTPDAATSIATALARRPDTYWVHVMSGGTEISCFVQLRTEGERDTLLLEKLPRTHRVLGVSAHAMLHGFMRPGNWSGGDGLSPDQVEQLRPPAPEPAPEVDGVTLGPADERLLAALSVDGRTGLVELAAASGLQEPAVRRRLAHLSRAGVLAYTVDIAPAALGHKAEARLWMSVRPSQLVPVAETLAQHPEAGFVAVTTGPTNLVAAVTCRDNRAFYRYLVERIGVLDAITSLETAPVMRTVKRSGSFLPI
ncbi:AsnC family transcriptional regulator [Nonomuraea pusilla]|uniref:Lrp/AsnC family transcriptional regulator n=1 Tax=Nonomuraea pusilla TaxID=46177 RepID=UPI00331A295C